MSKNKRKSKSRNGGPPSSSSPSRGRGGQSGSGHGSRGPPPNQGRAVPGSSFLPEEIDFTLQMYADLPHPPPASSTAYKKANPRGKGGGGFNPGHRGSGGSFRGNGRGRGEINTNHQLGSTPPNGQGRGRGRGEVAGYSPRHGRGLGASTEYTPTKPNPKNSTLSNLLSRPLLKPIKFVRAEHNPFLFEEKEELLQSITEEAGGDETSHVPTADRIERIFSGAAGPFDQAESSSSSEGEEEIVEVDFNDMGRLFDPPRQKQNSLCETRESDVNMRSSQSLVENGVMETHSQLDTSGTPSRFDDSTTGHPLFVVDTQPAPLPSSLEIPEPELPSEDEEIIVYVAPLPKISSRAPSRMQERPSLESANNTLDTSAFVPYTPSATLSLASKSLKDLSSPPPPQLVPVPESPSVPVQSASSTDVLPTASLPIQSVQDLRFEFSSSRNGSAKNGARRQLPSVMTSRMAKHQKAWEIKKAKRKRGKARSDGRRGSFAAFGSMVNDARLYEEDILSGDDHDPKWEQRRKGDSDIEWGTEAEAEDGDENNVVRAVENAVPVKSEKGKGKEKAIPQDGDDEPDHGMQVDEGLEVAAMKSFVNGLIGSNAGVHTTIGDLEIEERIRVEDAEGFDGGSEGISEDESVENILDLEERLMIGDLDDDDEDDESEDELELSPKTSFQARLDKLREKSRKSKPADRPTEGDESDGDEDVVERNMGWAEEEDYDDYDDDELIAHVQDVLEANADILEGRARKEKKMLFRAIQNGDFAEVQPAGKRKDKWKGLPKDLQKVWERDRQVKAELKRERELQKLITSMDPLAKKKGGKKGRKTMLKASSLDPATINLGPNRVIDFTTLVQQIRRFVDDLGGSQSMSLPPVDIWTRKNIHEVALAFGLNSRSTGKGNSRYTTLTKTTRTGLAINERKIANIMRRFGGNNSRQGDFEFGNHRGKQSVGPPKHKEGDEVGGSAPKLGQNNIGFKMLASMGWAEGERIGLSGGLEAPLVAIVKHSKLGLGAMK